MSKENTFVLDEIVLEMREYIANVKNLLNAIEEGLNCESPNIKKLSLYMAAEFAECMNNIHAQKEFISSNLYKLLDKLHHNSL